MKKTLLTMMASVMLMASAAHAADVSVSISNAWARATVPQQKSSGVFLDIAADQDAKLVKATSAVAKHTEIHEMKHEDGVMKMREVPFVALPAKQTVHLGPGGYHIMLIDLAAPIKEGDSIPLRLTVADEKGKEREIDVNAVARSLTEKAAPSDHMHGSGSHSH